MFTKQTKTEKNEVIPPQKIKRVEEALRKHGKASAQDLTDEEREQFTKDLNTPK